MNVTTSSVGPTGLDHEGSAAVEEAARWLSTTPMQDRPRPIIPAMTKRFGLTVKEACIAIQEAQLITARSH